ncbi:unnamed protein product [Moneuplotes crassus]|uniref:Uncharacterized protein n=1 Tax=Euplotes crassus TaxID=5936 RepID=A0AAD1XQB3_EUPCR|nr:unnamed protein product [Moneuplotes crassus]
MDFGLMGFCFCDRLNLVLWLKICYYIKLTSIFVVAQVSIQLCALERICRGINCFLYFCFFFSTTCLQTCIHFHLYFCRKSSTLIPIFFQENPNKLRDNFARRFNNNYLKTI